MSDDVLTILQVAIQKEEERQEYYEDAAQRACNPLAQQTFAFLAAEEARHLQAVEAFYEKMQTEKAWPDTSECGEQCKIGAQELDDIFASAREGIDGDVTCDTQITEAYKIGMQFERESITFYKDLLAAATDPNAQAFYQALLNAERMHLQLLAKTEEYLNDPAQWFFEEEGWIVEG